MSALTVMRDTRWSIPESMAPGDTRTVSADVSAERKNSGSTQAENVPQQHSLPPLAVEGEGAGVGDL